MNYTATFLLILLNYIAFAGEITVAFKGKPQQAATLSVLSRRFVEETDVVRSFENVGNNLVVFDLHLSHPQFVYLKISDTSIEVFIEPDEDYAFEFDFVLRRLVPRAGSAISAGAIIADWPSFYFNPSPFKDSISLVTAFFQWVDSKGLVTASAATDGVTKQRIKRRAFAEFVNLVYKSPLTNFETAAGSKVIEDAILLLDLKTMDLSMHSAADFMALRLLILMQTNTIYAVRPQDGKFDFAYICEKGKEWTESLLATKEVKTFLYGDLINWFSRFNYPISEKSAGYLRDFCEDHPIAPHVNFVKKLYEKQTAQLSSSSLLVIDCENLKGNKFRPYDFKEEIIFVDFWATWCGPCIAENPAIVKLQKMYEGRVKFVKISVDDSENNWKGFYRGDETEIDASFRLADEGRKETMDYYNLNAIPKFLIINRNGKILDINPPRPSDPDLRNVLDELVKQ